MEEQVATRSKKRSILALTLVFGPALFLIFIATRGCDHRFKELADYGLVQAPTFTVYNHLGKQEKNLKDYRFDEAAKNASRASETDIELVLQQTECTRERATQALDKHNQDIVEAIMEITNEQDEAKSSENGEI